MMISGSHGVVGFNSVFQIMCDCCHHGSGWLWDGETLV